MTFHLKPIVKLKTTKNIWRCLAIFCSIPIILLSIYYSYYYYRYFSALSRYPACRTGDETFQQKVYTDGRNAAKFSGLDNLENVTIFYRNSTTMPRCRLVKGRRIIVSYASSCCERAQVINCESSLSVGGFDVCVLFGPKSLDSSFQKRVIDPLLQKSSRGNGYWSWKPYIILRTLLEMDDDDVVLYADSGSEFIANFDIGPICLQAELNQDVTLFHLRHLEEVYTKSDAFVVVGCLSESCRRTPQIESSFVLLRKSFFSIQFISSWLTYASDPRVISDQPSTLVDLESSMYSTHRHDQSILSLLAKKWGLFEQAWPDPSQYLEEAVDARLPNMTTRYLKQQYIYHSRLKL